MLDSIYHNPKTELKSLFLRENAKILQHQYITLPKSVNL